MSPIPYIRGSWLSSVVIPANPCPKYDHLLYRIFSGRSCLSGSKPENYQNLMTSPRFSERNDDPNITLTSIPSRNFDQSDFTTLCGLLADPSLSSGSLLDHALARSGIEPSCYLLQAIFNHSDSSPQSLLSLFTWAKMRPGFVLSSSLFDSVIDALSKAHQFDSAWSVLLDQLNCDGEFALVSIDTFEILVRRYAGAGMAHYAIRAFEFACNSDLIKGSNSSMALFERVVGSLCNERHVAIASECVDRKRTLDGNWVPSVKVYNILLNGWFRMRKIQKMEQLWLQMRNEKVTPTDVTFALLVEGYCRIRHIDKALELVEEMRRQRIDPNPVVYNLIIDALGEAGKLKEALGMMERLLLSASGPTIITYNSLVKAFCKAGDLVGASKIVKAMVSRGSMPTIMTYNYFFLHFSKAAKFEEGLNLYAKMVESRYMPDRRTLHLLMKMLCKQEQLDLVVKIKKDGRFRGCDMDLDTRTMLVHLFCKVDRLEDAVTELKDMVFSGMIPHYIVFQKVTAALNRKGMTDLIQEMWEMMEFIHLSKKLSDTGGEDRDMRRTSIMQRASAMSDILGSRRNPSKLVKLRGSSKSVVSSANIVVENIKNRAYGV